MAKVYLHRRIHGSSFFKVTVNLPNTVRISLYVNQSFIADHYNS